MKPNLTIGALAALFLTCAASAQPAAAFTTEDYAMVRKVRVDYRRSDILDEAGARKVLEQLGRAARKVCTMDGPGVRARAGHDFEACRALAETAAVREVNSPLLTALHQGERAPVALASR